MDQVTFVLGLTSLLQQRLNPQHTTYLVCRIYLVPLLVVLLAVPCCKRSRRNHQSSKTVWLAG